MKTSLPKARPIVYASRISEYVTPPAINRIILCLPSVFATRADGALCQVGLALRKEDVGAVGGGARAPVRMDCVNSGGVSRMKGNRDWSSRLLWCSCNVRGPSRLRTRLTSNTICITGLYRESSYSPSLFVYFCFTRPLFDRSLASLMTLMPR